MFPPDPHTPISWRLRLRALADLLVEFATLGEYTLDGPVDAPAEAAPSPAHPHGRKLRPLRRHHRAGDVPAATAHCLSPVWSAALTPARRQPVAR